MTKIMGSGIVFSMRKLSIFIILCLIAQKGYCFWVWSPKTQEWKNPQYSPLATPALQYEEAVKDFETGDYKEAYKGFKKVIVNYPDAKEAAEAQYYIGRCLESMEQPYKAYLEYQKVIDIYPNSKRINEIVKRQYDIGEFFLNREPKKWLGISLYDFVEHPTIVIFQTLVDKVPYSEYASQAQYKIGILKLQLGRYDEARDAFQKVIDNYPDSELAAPARYQLAIATSKASYGVDYDSTSIEEASSRLDEFVKKHPEADISAKAKEQLQQLRTKEAKKTFDIAAFYERQKKYKSAVIYYQKIMDEYYESDYAKEAKARIAVIEERK